VNPGSTAQPFPTTVGLGSRHAVDIIIDTIVDAEPEHVT
jgi:hypothetical protein